MILSWRHVLQSIGLLLTYASDETVNEWVLTCLEKYAFFCARFALQETTICSIEVLASYALPSQLSKAIFDKPIWRLEKDCFDFRFKLNRERAAGGGGMAQSPSQILVIGQPLIPVNGINGQGFVCLTAKNMQVMQALIRLGRQASLFLSDAWLPLLYGFAHGAWIMGLRADVEKADGSLTIARTNMTGPSNDPTLVTTAARNRLAFIAAEIQKVFDTAASELDEVPLHHLVSALGQLSQQELECSLNQLKRNKLKKIMHKQEDEMGGPGSDQNQNHENEQQEQTEPGLFALSQLVRVANCCVVTNRANLVISPVSGHLFEACQNTHRPVRTFAARSLCSLVKQYLDKEPSTMNALRPIQRLSEVQYIDVKTIQIEFLERMIDQHGNNFNEDQWIKILEMVRSACLVKPDPTSSEEVFKSGLKQAKEGTGNVDLSNSTSLLAASPTSPVGEGQISAATLADIAKVDSAGSTGDAQLSQMSNPASGGDLNQPVNITHTASTLSNMSNLSANSGGIINERQLSYLHTKPSAILAKSAFRLLQLICDEFLETVSGTGERALFKLIRACGSIGQQTFELNVSLTAVGLLWSICDYLGSRGNPDLEEDQDENNTDNLVLGTIRRMKMFDSSATIHWHESLTGVLLNDKDIAALTATTVMHQNKLQNGWLAIFAELSLLCMNFRPAMRKSAVQSLFQTINAHVDQLNEITTDCLLYIVVRLPQGCNPPKEEEGSKEGSKSQKSMETSITSTNSLTHHSRDSQEKQWAETRAQVLTGMAKVIAEARVVVDHRHWVACLSEISLATKTPSPEVCNAALIGLKILLDKKNVGQINDKRKPKKHQDRDNLNNLSSTSELSSNWRMAWNCWLEIGRSKTVPLPVKASDLSSLGDLTDVQKLLIIHTEQACVLLKRMTENQHSGQSGDSNSKKQKSQNSNRYEYSGEYSASTHVDAQLAFEGLGLGDLKSLFEMLTRTLSLPVFSDWPPLSEHKYEDGFNPIMDNVHSGLATIKPQLTALQIKCLGIVHQAQVQSNSVLQHHLLPLIFEFLLTHSNNLWDAPKVAAQGDIAKYIQSLSKNGGGGGRISNKASRVTLILSNPVGLGRRCLQLISSIFKQNRTNPALIQNFTAIKLLEKLSTPLQKLHDPVSWQIAAQTTIDILSNTIPLVEYPEDPDRFAEFDSHIWRACQKHVSKKFIEDFWSATHDCTKAWFGNLSSALSKNSSSTSASTSSPSDSQTSSKNSNSMSAQQQQVLIELDRRFIEFLRAFVLTKKKNIHYKHNQAIHSIVDLMKDTANGNSGEVLGLESQRQASCANRCFQALVKGFGGFGLCFSHFSLHITKD